MAPDEFSTGWKMWPDSSFEWDRSIFSISLHGTFRAIFVWPSHVSVSVSYLFYQPMDEKIKTWPLRFPAKENPNMEKAFFDWPVVLQYDVKAKYRLISRKFSNMKFFHPVLPTKSHACLYPFDKPIKSLYFRSFVVSVLFARFHFKVTWKSL